MNRLRFWIAGCANAAVVLFVFAIPVFGEDDGFVSSDLYSGYTPPAAAPSPSEDVEPALDRFSADLDAVLERLNELEQAQAKQSEDDQRRKAAAAKRPTVNWSGELQLDRVMVNQDQESKQTFGDIENGEAFRRARMAMFGEYGLTEYRIEMDFAQPGRPTFLDVWVGMRDLPGVGKARVGHFFEPFSLDRLTSNRFVTFMERSLMDQAFVPARNSGIAAGDNWLEDRGTWAVGFFRSGSDAFGDQVGDGFESSVTGRATWLPWYDEATGSDYLHLGVDYSFRGSNNGVVQFRAQPEARIGAASPNIPFFVDTGNIPADTYQLMGLEAAWVHERISFQSEYVLAPVATQQEGTLFFQGFYSQVSLFLTEDFRPYRKEFGVFDRVRPRRDFLKYHGPPENKCLEFGPGAWEFAMRVSYVDLNAGTVRGGRLTDMTVGLNWYLNPHTRITSNWVRAFLDDPDFGHSVTDIFAVRAGFEF